MPPLKYPLIGMTASPRATTAPTRGDGRQVRPSAFGGRPVRPGVPPVDLLIYANDMARKAGTRRGGQPRRVVAAVLAVAVGITETLKIAAGYAGIPSLSQLAFLGIAAVSAGSLAMIMSPQPGRKEEN